MFFLFLCSFLWAEETNSTASESGKSTGFNEKHVWRPLGLNRNTAALVTASDGSLIALDMKGRIYSLSRDGRWLQRLGLAFDEQKKNNEDVLLDIESTLEEMIDFEDEENPELEDEEDVSSPEQQGFDEEIESGLMDPLRNRQNRKSQVLGLWSDVVSNLLIACRADGCLRSRDSGKNWEKMASLPIAQDILFAHHLWPELAIAATVDGIWTSTNQGRTWRRASKTTSGVPFTGLTTDGKVIYASSVEGVYLSIDGVLWAKNSKEKKQDYIDIVVDPDADGSIWVASENKIFRSDDAGQSWSRLPQNHPNGIRRILHAKLPGHLLLISSQGLWMSRDGGVRWSPLARGLSTRNIYDVILWKNSMACASRDGIFYLDFDVDAGLDPGTKHTIKARPLRDVLRVSLRDIEGQMSELDLKASMLKRSVVPTLSIFGEIDRNLSLATDYSSISSNAMRERDIRVGFELCFGGCGSVNTTTSLPVEDVMVIDGSVYASDAAGVVPAAAGISSSLIKYRQAVLDYVIGLYTTHQRLLRQQKRIQRLSLLEQVKHELELQEVVSRLDVVTDGTYYQQSFSLEE